MPTWALIAVIGGTILVAASAVAAGLFAWRAYERRILLRLLVRAEAVEAATAALSDTVTRLAEGSDEQLEAFADDPDFLERRTLGEVQSRASILAYELDRLPVPRRLEPAVEALGDAAYLVAEQAAVVRDEDVGATALERLGLMDLSMVRSYTKKARILVTEACDVCRLDETAVYGGGLYL